MEDAPAVGMRVAVETSAGDKVEGEVFTYDANANCVVLEEFIPQTQKKNIRIMKASMIKQVKVLSTPESRGGVPAAALNLPPVDIDRVMDAEARAMHEAADGRRLIGKGVTPEAQDLFDALYKTLPCEWRGTTVVVGVVGQNEVIVTPPYTPESATGGDDKSLAHVQKVLAGELKKLKE